MTLRSGHQIYGVDYTIRRMRFYGSPTPSNSPLNQLLGACEDSDFAGRRTFPERVVSVCCFHLPRAAPFPEREGLADHQSFALDIKLLAPVVFAKKGPANFDFMAIGAESAVSGGTHQQAGGFINEAESAAISWLAIEEGPEFRDPIAILRGMLFLDARIACQRIQLSKIL